MPNGRVKWYDTGKGTGVVEHNGREYAVEDTDIESHARRPDAPVHFDIDRTDDGAVARSVELRAGSRTSHTSKGVGDMAGAHHPSEKGQDEDVGGQWRMRRRAYGQQPRALVDDWVGFLSRQQIDDAVQLYAPDAVVHVAGSDVAGARDIRQWLQESQFHGASDAHVDVEDDHQGRFTIRWRIVPGDQGTLETTMRVTDGMIVEQTLGGAS